MTVAMNLARTLAIVVCALAGAPALGQMVLPGAVDASRPGASVAAPNLKKIARMRPAALAGVVGQTLALNGSSGALVLAKQGEALRIEKLALRGEAISNSAQICEISVVGKEPIVAKSLGRPEGSERFEAEIPACPFTFDILAGAVSVPPQTSACIFKAADCQASAGGLWGPPLAALATQAKAVERARNRAELALAANVKALAADKTAPARARAAGLARDQTRFAADRDEACRDYVGEATYGFCAASLTQARATALGAQVAALKAERQ